MRPTAGSSVSPRRAAVPLFPRRVPLETPGRAAGRQGLAGDQPRLRRTRDTPDRTRAVAACAPGRLPLAPAQRGRASRLKQSRAEPEEEQYRLDRDWPRNDSVRIEAGRPLTGLALFFSVCYRKADEHSEHDPFAKGFVTARVPFRRYMRMVIVKVSTPGIDWVSVAMNVK